MWIYHNETWPLSTEASHYFDRGWLLGDGFFTTIRFFQGTLYFWKEHWNRLEKSSQVFQIPLPLSAQQLSERIDQLVQKNELGSSSAAIRVTVTRGIQKERGLCAQDLQPNLVVTATPYQLKTEPIRVGISSFRRFSQTPLASLKHLGYQSHILAHLEGQSHGYHDMILLNEQGNLCCTTFGNLFCYHTQEGWITPPLEDGCIEGVMRQSILQKYSIPERSISMQDLKKIQEAFFTNSLRGMIPFLSLQDRPLTTTCQILDFVELRED
jgi:branched-subunit amino acid aminotransferase/4-amino-4-deoxychorismate lyase